MARLIDAATQVLESLVAAAEHKTRHRGSWYAINDPDYDPEGKLDALQSEKVAHEVQLQRAQEEFKQSLSPGSRRLRRAWKKMEAAPELHDEEDIQQAKQAYEASLDDAQRGQERELREMRGKHVTYKMLGRLARGMEAAGSTHNILRTLKSMLMAPIDEAHARAGLIRPVEAVLQRVTHALDAQCPGGASPIAIIMGDMKDSKWQVMPSGTGSEKGFDLRRLIAILQQEVARELADPSPWKRVSASVRGVATPALYIEGPEQEHHEIAGSAALVAASLRGLPGMEGKIVPVYKIDGAAVSETFYQSELKQRDIEGGHIAADTDYSGLSQGTMFIGPQAEAVVQEYLGVDTHRIREARRRAR